MYLPALGSGQERPLKCRETDCLLSMITIWEAETPPEGASFMKEKKALRKRVTPHIP